MKNSKKLQLKRETVQTLTADALSQVAGGKIVITNPCLPPASHPPAVCAPPPPKQM